MNHLTHIEPLEARIAPATIINPYTVTFQNFETNSSGQQIYGDTVIVKISKPLFVNPIVAANILNFTDSDGNLDPAPFIAGNTVAQNLARIELEGVKAAQGMDISVKVIPQAGVGQFQVNVGDIDAGDISNFQATKNIDLGNVYIQGNLGEITVGDDYSTPAIQSLTVLSMNEALGSTVLGPIVKMNVMGDFNANLNVIGYQFGTIGTLNIGGSLAGINSGVPTSDTGTGLIQFSGRIGQATIGNITGTDGDHTGELLGGSGEASSIGTLDVLGSITGGAGVASGHVFVNGRIGKLIVGGSIMGGTAGTAASGTTAASPGDSGVVQAASAGAIMIGGSLIGGSPVSGATNGAGVADQTADTSGAIVINSVHSLTIMGDIMGGGGPNSGVIMGAGGATPLYASIVVDGAVTGGAGALSGAIDISGTSQIGTVAGTITNLHIGGSLTGGAGTQSGFVATGAGLGTLYIAGSVTGGAGTQSGYVGTNTALGSLFIGGNLTGGTADNTGEILAGGALTHAIIQGNLAGNGATAINSTTAVMDLGYIQAAHIGALDIGGNVTSGTNSGGAIANSGAIRSSIDILSLTIGGKVTGTAADPVVISAQQGPGTAAHLKTDLAIQTVTIDHAVSYLDLLAGYGPAVTPSTTDPAAVLGTPMDGAAQIGSLNFGSTLSASNLVAGASPDASGFFGTKGDMAIAPRSGATKLKSSIAEIIVAGAATGDSKAKDSFGFVAETLAQVSVNGVALSTALTPGKPVAVNKTNLFLLEVAPAG